MALVTPYWKLNVVVVAGVAVAALAVPLLRDEEPPCNSPISANLWPDLGGIEVIANEHAEPSEGCGGGERLVYLTGSAADDVSLLELAAAQLAARGWKPKECVTSSERCFRTDDLFVSLAVPCKTELPTHSAEYCVVRRGSLIPQIVAGLGMSASRTK